MEMTSIKFCTGGLEYGLGEFNFGSHRSYAYSTSHEGYTRHPTVQKAEQEIEKRSRYSRHV
jgi:hypothetical protein